MQTYRLMWRVVLMVAVVAWLGWGTPQALAQRARVPQTGQTTSYAPGDDGAIQAGVEWPTPRFTDRRNGTVRDNLTGLIWLQNADCFSSRSWPQALTDANTLASGRCGLTDGSVAGDWRLPNVRELLSLIDYGASNPALPSGHPFLNVFSLPGDPGGYWSSTIRADDAQADVINPQVVSMVNGLAGCAVGLPPAVYRVWPVQGGDQLLAST